VSDFSDLGVQGVELRAYACGFNVRGSEFRV
jgi:hypothetical protein